MKLALVPLGDRILVELVEQYQNIATVEGKYDTKTSGICLAVNIGIAANNMHAPELWQSLIGKKVFWEQYKDGEHIIRDKKKYAFIKLEDVDGYETD